MTITEAAAALKRSDMTVRRWIKMEYIKGIQIGKIWDIPESEIERLKTKGARLEWRKEECFPKQ